MQWQFLIPGYFSLPWPLIIAGEGTEYAPMVVLYLSVQGQGSWLMQPDGQSDRLTVIVCAERNYISSTRLQVSNEIVCHVCMASHLSNARQRYILVTY